MNAKDELSGIQKLVYEWILQNPWKKRAVAGKEIAKHYMVTSQQVYNAHITITQKGLLRKKGASMNTIYAVKESESNSDELEREAFETWFDSEWREVVELYPRMEKIRYKNIAKSAWLARSKQEAQ